VTTFRKHSRWVEVFILIQAVALMRFHDNLPAEACLALLRMRGYLYAVMVGSLT